MTYGDDPTARGLDGPIHQTVNSRRTPAVVAMGASLRLSEEPDDHDESAQWDLMLTRLATDRVRHLLEEAIGTLEQLVPVREPPIDTALQHLRSARRQLAVQ
jgi:hypothetical protein